MVLKNDDPERRFGIQELKLRARDSRLKDRPRHTIEWFREIILSCISQGFDWRVLSNIDKSHRIILSSSVQTWLVETRYHLQDKEINSKLANFSELLHNRNADRLHMGCGLLSLSAPYITVQLAQTSFC